MNNKTCKIDLDVLFKNLQNIYATFADSKYYIFYENDVYVFKTKTDSKVDIKKLEKLLINFLQIMIKTLQLLRKKPIQILFNI